MVSVVSVLAVLSGIILIGFFAEYLFRKTRIPDVLFLIAIGIAIGFFYEGFDGSNLGIAASVFATFALLFLLFQGALNINFRDLFRSLNHVLSLTIISFILAVAVVGAIAFFMLGFPILISILLGMILGGTSSAVVIPFVKHISLKKDYGLVLALESAVSDVFCIIGAITIIAILKTGEISASSVVRDVVTSFALAIVVGVVAGLIWMFVLYKSKLLSKSFMVTIAVLVGLYVLVESPFIGASGAIAVLAFGLILGNSQSILKKIRGDPKEVIKSVKARRTNVFAQEANGVTESARDFYSEISFFVKVFFFVYLGLLFEFSTPIVFLYALVIVLGMFLIRPLAVKISFFREKMDIKDKTEIEALIPKGLAAAVLSQLAIQEGVPYAQEIASVVLAVILISIIISSVLVFLAEHGMWKGVYHVFSRKRVQEKQEVKEVEIVRPKKKKKKA